MNKQRGGTLLGFIIGALVGLGVALAVAVYITKVPVPFMNKSSPRNPDGDAAEAKRNRDWNPNAPLAGKNPAPAPAATPGVAPVAPPAPAAVVDAKPGTAGLGKSAGPAASADPIGDLAKARTEVPALPGIGSGSGIDPFTYFVQAGAYRTPEDAEQQRARLTLLGVQAKVSEREQSGRTVYRVRLGPFERKEDADRAKARLDGNSIETALVRVQR
jgi:cell division protein FtsN